jgi:hypothetical protein
MVDIVNDIAVLVEPAVDLPQYVFVQLRYKNLVNHQRYFSEYSLGDVGEFVDKFVDAVEAPNISSGWPIGYIKPLPGFGTTYVTTSGSGGGGGGSATVTLSEETVADQH